MAAPSPSPMQLLADMNRASHRLNYAGRFVYSRQDQLSSLSILHVHDKQGTRVRLAYLDGRAAEILHLQDRMLYVHPDLKVTQMAAGGSLIPFILSKRLTQHLPSYYHATLHGLSRVAGRTAWCVALMPTDHWRYGYKLWLDEQSRLLLKTEVLNPAGRRLEQVEFTSLTLNPDYSDASFALPKGAVVTPATQKPSGSKASATSAAPEIAIKVGWLPEGFKRMPAHHTGKPALETRTYSDGLAVFTLFVRPASHAMGQGRLGATVVLSQLVDSGKKSFQVMLMGELPDAAARRILASVELIPVP